MSAYQEKLDQMLSVWNTTDTAEQATLVESALEHNVHFVDPKNNIIGRSAFLDMVSVVQAEIPNARYSPASEIDVQNNFCRYHWAIHVQDKLLVRGFDTVEVNDAGKILKVIGFFGELNYT